MMQRPISAVFMRGGTSKALMFQAADLPVSREEWAPLFSAAMGSPDPYGRQLDGMGGGISSLSKVCVLSVSERADADIDYTFAQVKIEEEHVDYRGNCGNMSAAVGPYAVDEQIVKVTGNSATVRIFNTNTSKLIHATFPLDEDGTSCYDGDFVIPGVGGSGAPIRLDFLDPGGATTGRLLPTGRTVDQMVVPEFGAIDVSMVDAGNAAVFVRAADIGLTGLELPDELGSWRDVLVLLDSIRREASVRMGIARDTETARNTTSVPFVCLVSPPADNKTSSGQVIHQGDVDLVARAISNGQPHRALPLTVSLCMAVAASISGTIVADTASSPTDRRSPLRLGMPSGVLAVDADVAYEGGEWNAPVGSFYRTARRLFDGRVWVPGATAV